MLTLSDGRSELWQWDTGRTLSVPDDCSQVHFSNKVFGRSVDVDVVDGKASIPDILLQTDKELTAWAFIGTVENGYTKISKVFKVNKRNKPSDYVFTHTDQTTLGEILDRIEDLENRPSGDVSKEDIQNAVNDYLDKNPISVEETDPTVPDWAKQPEKPTYTAAEVGALPADTPIPEGITIPSSAQVGQTIVVKAVDENGKPTEWETAELPEGGSAKWNLVADITLEEENYLVRQTVGGYEDYLIFVRAIPGASGSEKSTITIDVFAGQKTNEMERYIVNDAVWNNGKTAIVTQAHFFHPKDAKSIYGFMARKGGGESDSYTSCGDYRFANANGEIIQFDIYTNHDLNVFGIGTQVQIYGR